MNAIEAMASELIKELQTTRKLLERVPEERFEWKPHPKSMSVRQLVSHIATIAEWMGVTLSQTEYVLDGSHVPFGADSSAELLRVFDANASKAVSMLREQTGETLSVKWRLISGGHVAFELPRAVIVRSLIINHLIHHRGQLSVYLRLLNVPVPSIYGPSADESQAGEP